MTLHWFTPPSPGGADLSTLLANLHPFGVRWCAYRNRPEPPSPTYWVEDGMVVKDVGWIVYRVPEDVVNIYPNTGLSRTDMMTLARCGQDALERRPSRANHWRYYRKGGRKFWQTRIIVRANEGEDAVAAAVAYNVQSNYDQTLALLDFTESSYSGVEL